MLVLQFILGFIAAAAIYLFIEWFNGYTDKKVRYRFFTQNHTIAYVAGYLLLFGGYILMKKQWLGDPLNGLVLIPIGTYILVRTIQNNFDKTRFWYALVGSIIQVILYIPITVVAMFVIYGAIVFFSKTRPVYTINGKD